MCALEYHLLFPKQNTSGASMTPMLTAVILLDHLMPSFNVLKLLETTTKKCQAVHEHYIWA
jgi:hypothetical protein